jgi:cation transport regulator ChaC
MRSAIRAASGALGFAASNISTPTGVHGRRRVDSTARGAQTDGVEPGDETLWYFAYGSNLHDAIFRERRRMDARAVRRAWLDDFQLCFNLPVGPGKRGVANVEPVPGASICGAIYLLTAADCARLDRSEGVPFGAYHRFAIDVRLDDGARQRAFTYRSTRTRAGRKPSARYLRLIIEGACQRGLPEDYVRWLGGFELAFDERESA